MKTVYIHLFNSYTGSPVMLAQLIKCTNPSDSNNIILTNQTPGALSDLALGYHYLHYVYTPNQKLLTLIRWFWAQVLIFFKLLTINPERVVVNTIHPFGGMIYAYLFRKQNLIYVHEHDFGNEILTKFLFFLVKKSKNILVVSETLKNSRKELVNASVIPNSHSIDIKFTQRKNLKTLGIVSMGNFDKKGVHAFIELARKQPGLKFVLQTGLNETDLSLLMAKVDDIPKNLEYRSFTNKMQSFYTEIDLIFNLSNPKFCIETFGLTIIEGQANGVPAIGPKVGGPSEIINNGLDGYLIDPTDVLRLNEIIESLVINNELYQIMCQKAYENSKLYSQSAYCTRVNAYMNQLK